MARCPAHDDQQNSLSIGVGDHGETLIHCFAGCQTAAIVEGLGLNLRDLFPSKAGQGGGEGGMYTPPENGSTVQHPPGCTIATYAEAKRLPEPFLRGLGLTDTFIQGRPTLRIPYFDAQGSEVTVRFRHAVGGTGDEGGARFTWRKGSKPTLYGLWKLPQARSAGHVVLAEGESDCHTLWLHGIPALGLPGAASWKEDWAAILDDITLLYVVVEPDKGGDAVLQWLATSRIRDRVRLVRLGEVKDPSELYLLDPSTFGERWRAACEAATPWTDQAQAAAASRAQAAWKVCEPLAREPRILDRFADALDQHGVVGERRAAQLVYLIVTSRLLDRPVNAVVKGPSSAGKSYMTECVLAFFPPNAYFTVSGMSERALVYSDEPLQHRVLVIFEAHGVQGEFASYLLRSLLSEGRVRYVTVEKTPAGLKPRTIDRQGPTGLLITTTAVKLHDENETRLFSIPVTDTPAQTKEVIRRLAEGRPGVDLAPWQALQEWLEHAERRVVIPFASALAELVPPVAVRLRRDFGAILGLIRAHAILHQASRERDAAGSIIATLDDYAVVRELVADLVAHGVEAAVSATVRETVAVVRALHPENRDGVSVVAVARTLGVDKSAASRRVQAAVSKGYIRNLETKKGQAARLVPGEPLPDDRPVLPFPDHPLLNGYRGEGGGNESERPENTTPEEWLL
jgi:hypothetical protein